MSISQLATALDVSRVAVYHLFKGNYSREMLRNISKILNIPVHVLLTPFEQNEGTQAMRLLSAYQASPKNIQAGIDAILGVQQEGSEKFAKKSVAMLSPDGTNKELISLLFKEDVHLVCLSDADAFCDIIQQHEFQLAILDAKSATEKKLLDALSEKRGIKMPPLLVLSSTTKPREKYNLENVSYLAKPIDNEEFHRQFERLVFNGEVSPS